jgi:alkylation response protein AidB-like acyl-CoA dehydrogenase
VEASMPGFERGCKLDKVGQPEADTSELFFDDVRVPAENVIGEVDRGFGYMMQRLVAERIGSAVNNITQARQILEETVDYVKQRKAFGTPIGSFQANKFTLAELQTVADVTQSFVDDCVMEAALGTLTAVDAAKAKWWSAQVQNDILDACLQLWGGYGYMSEYRVARAWADARVSKIWAGSNEIMKELIGRELGL